MLSGGLQCLTREQVLNEVMITLHFSALARYDGSQSNASKSVYRNGSVGYKFVQTTDALWTCLRVFTGYGLRKFEYLEQDSLTHGRELTVVSYRDATVWSMYSKGRLFMPLEGPNLPDVLMEAYRLAAAQSDPGLHVRGLPRSWGHSEKYAYVCSNGFGGPLEFDGREFLSSGEVTIYAADFMGGLEI
jgi:hypothetical protein